MPRLTGRVLAFALACLLAPASLQAVIIMGPLGRDTSPPVSAAERALWNLQGAWGDFLGTPIGENYFLAATHVGGGSGQSFVFQGHSYSIDASYGSGGVYHLPGSDLSIWKVTESFPTYAPLYSKSDEAGRHMIVFGRGTQRGGPVIDNSATLHGWLWGLNDHAVSWGENDVAGVVTAPNVGQLIGFTFDQGAGDHESSLSSGDSSGGVFILDSGVWKLAGLSYAAEGTYSASADGSNPFQAALFDKQGFYEDQGNGSWVLNTEHEPGASYASRISSRYNDIMAAVPEPGLIGLLGVWCVAALLRPRRA